MSRETELAWAAGFFDGEGHTRIDVINGKRGRPEGYLHLAMNVAQVRREPLERFLRAVGAGTIYLEPRTPPNNDIYRWACGGNGSVRKVIDQLWPYLSEPKREQIKAALDRLEQDLRDNPRDHYRMLRERIVQLHAEGLNSLQVASAVGRSRRTVNYHLHKSRQGGGA